MNDAGSDERYDRFRSAWRKLSDQARGADLFGGAYDPPLAQLIDASEGTVLRRFYPFTSMARLCFACSAYPFERVQPTCVEFGLYGFRVLDGGPYPATSDPPVAVETDDPRAAIDEAIRRLVGC